MTPPPEAPGSGPGSTTPEPGPSQPAYTTFDDFYAGTHALFLGYALRHTSSREQALDAVQEAYLDVFARWNAINNPTAYGITAVRRNVHAQVRLWARTIPTSTPEDAAPHPLEPDPTETITLIGAIKELPPIQRTVFVAYYQQSLTSIEIATALHITVGTVRSHLTHARRRLRQLLTEPPPPPAAAPTHPNHPPTAPHPKLPTLQSVYDGHVDSIYRYISLLTGTGPTAEDLTSKTFRRALPHLTAADPTPRLIATARRLLADELDGPLAQHPHRQHAATALRAATVHEPPPGLPLDTLLEALNRLSTPQYECIVLRFIQGLTIAESAHVMSRSEGALKLLQHRALKNLAHHLEDEPLPHTDPPEPADVSRVLHAVAPRCSNYLKPNPSARTRMRASIERHTHSDTGLTR
ncbi:sigma-70 family RNA polymerase sigma factor [Streptomyces chartreusis]